MSCSLGESGSRWSGSPAGTPGASTARSAARSDPAARTSEPRRPAGPATRPRKESPHRQALKGCICHIDSAVVRAGPVGGYVHVQSQRGPSDARPRSPLTVLQRFSRFFWFSAAFGVFAGWAVLTDPATPTSTSTGSRIVSATFAVFFFGATPYAVRWFVRKRRSSRRVQPSSRITNIYVPLDSSPEFAPPNRRTEEHNQPTLGEAAVVAPSAALALADLHQVVVTAAESTWSSGHYRHAVEQASRAVSAFAQQKLGRFSITDDQLIREGFSTNPPAPGVRRLRFPGDRSTPSWTNRMRGAIALSQGCYAGIRNVAAHEANVPWSRIVAFEYLVAFSILARWIDECDVDRVD